MFVLMDIPWTASGRNDEGIDWGQRLLSVSSRFWFTARFSELVKDGPSSSRLVTDFGGRVAA